MRSPKQTFLVLLTLVPVVAMLVAVLTVPRSANALPVFEFGTAKGPLRVTSADLGVVRGEDGLTIDQERFDDAIASYRRFLAHWKDGDPGLPGVVLVRGRLDALRDRAGSATRAAPAEQEPDPAPSRPQRVMTRMGGSL